MIYKQSNCLGSLSYFPIFLGKFDLFWHRTFAVVLGIRLIRRRWKGCWFWDVPFTVCCGFSNLDTGSSCYSSSSVIALLVVWSDHLSVYKDLRSFVEASDKFRRSLRWIAIHKKQIVWDGCPISQFFLGKLDLFCHFFGNNRGFGWLFLLFHGYNYFRRNIPLNLMKTSGADLTCSTLIPMPRQRQVVLFCQQWPQSYGGMD